MLGSATLGANATATFSTTPLADGSHSLTAAYSGDSDFAASTSSAVNVMADFSLSAASLALSAFAPGQSANSNLSITPSNGCNASSVTFSCTIAPVANPAPTCTVGSISVANGVGTAKLTVTTEGSVALQSRPDSALLFAVGLLIPGLVLGAAGLRSAQGTKFLFLAVLFLALAGCILQSACGGNSTNSNANNGATGTPAGSYTITITGHR